MPVPLAVPYQGMSTVPLSLVHICTFVSVPLELHFAPLVTTMYLYVLV